MRLEQQEGGMAKTTKRAGPRKEPTQARSQARVASILKAASALLGEVGYADLSTNLIAERAKIPVGSIYQFFDGKDDIVAAVVEQFRTRILALAGELDVASARKDQRAFIARLIDEMSCPSKIFAVTASSLDPTLIQTVISCLSRGRNYNT